MDTRLKYVVGKSKVGDLLKKYNILKHVVREKQYAQILYRNCESQILSDIPRTFPNSKWMTEVKNHVKIIELMQIFLLHSNIGYLQGQLFIAIPLLKIYDKQEYLAFWSFIEITELLRPIYLSLLPRNSKGKITSILKVIDIWAQIKKIKIKKDECEMLYNVLMWKFMSTLYLSITGDSLNNVELLMDYFLHDIHNERLFQAKLHAFSLALLLSILHTKQINFDIIAFLSSCYLSTTALEHVLNTSKQCEYLFI